MLPPILKRKGSVGVGDATTWDATTQDATTRDATTRDATTAGILYVDIDTRRQKHDRFSSPL
jgi:hypothetical protein